MKEHVMKRPAATRTIVAAALALAFAVLPSARAGALTWDSYAEAGAGLSLAGGVARPVLALDSGIMLGGFEFGTYLAALPLEFGSPDLVQAAAVYYGGTIGKAFGAEGAVRPFGRIGLGGAVRERADSEGGYDGDGADRYFSVSFVAGAEIPLGGRWSLRPWAAYRLSPDGKDYEGRTLSGPDFGLAVRATWETTIR